MQQENKLFEHVKGSETISWSLDDSWDNNLTQNINHYLLQKRHISSKNKKLAIQLKNAVLASQRNENPDPSPLKLLDTIQQQIPARGWNLKPSFLFNLSTFAKNMHTVHKARGQLAKKTQEYYLIQQKKIEDSNQQLNNDVTAKVTDLQVSEKQITALTQRNTELEQEVRELRTNNTNLTKDVSSLKEDVIREKKHNLELINDKREQTKECMALKNKCDEYEKERELQKLKMKKDRKQSQEQLPKQDVNINESQNPDIAKLRSTQKDLEEDIQRLSVEKATLNDENKNLQKQIQKLERDKEELKLKAERAQEDLNIVSQSAETAQKEAKKLEHENTILKNTLEKVKSWIHNVFGKNVTGTKDETFDLIKEGRYSPTPRQMTCHRRIGMAGRINVALEDVDKVVAEEMEEMRAEAVKAKPPTREDKINKGLQQTLSNPISLFRRG